MIKTSPSRKSPDLSPEGVQTRHCRRVARRQAGDSLGEVAVSLNTLSLSRMSLKVGKVCVRSLVYIADASELALFLSATL
ncbi:hypothetical protein L596_021130 [Steinernema carpocapsae]|uniref:Uncharacterized protein n=1 Tax=Steinernema carpocapsae TaxID=34508 RepID=A0A4U5MVT8_STECR|nr:hypothetical protein L596_021130 [Steinernema carpocapsae]